MEATARTRKRDIERITLWGRMRYFAASAMLVWLLIPEANASVMSVDALQNPMVGPGLYWFGYYHSPRDHSFQEGWSVGSGQTPKTKKGVKSIGSKIFQLPIFNIHNFQLTFRTNTTTGGSRLQAALPAGAYRFSVSGSPYGLVGGIYLGQTGTGVTAVPLPPAAFLLASALLLLTGVARHRTTHA